MCALGKPMHEPRPRAQAQRGAITRSAGVSAGGISGTISGTASASVSGCEQSAPCTSVAPQVLLSSVGVVLPECIGGYSMTLRDAGQNPISSLFFFLVLASVTSVGNLFFVRLLSIATSQLAAKTKSSAGQKPTFHGKFLPSQRNFP